MPTGVYYRSEDLKKKVSKCLEIGRSPKYRAIVAEKIRKMSKTKAWRDNVSLKTKEAMSNPEIRKKHIAGINKWSNKGIVNFRGGNGQQLTKIVLQTQEILSGSTFVREYAIKTAGHKTNYSVPTCYKVDFGCPVTMVAIELDGIKHRCNKQRELDKKKSEVLESLGWRVLRIHHF